MKAIVTFFCVSIMYFTIVASQKQCPNAPSQPQDRRPNKKSLTIATYNAEWLFLNRSNCPGTGCPWQTESEATHHMKVIADELIHINADIVNIVEVQDCYVLTKINQILTGKGMNYLPYLLTGTDTATGQNVGLLTRVDPSSNLQRSAARVTYPIPSSTCGSTYAGDTGVSKHFFTTFQVSGLSKPLSFFGMHLLAYPDDPVRCVQREAQASVLKPLIADALTAGHSVVVLGDINDFDSTVKDASGNVPISSVLSILRNPVASTPGDELVNVAQYVSTVSERYSCWYDRNGDCKTGEKEFSLIDHLLISNDLTSKVSHAYMDHSYAASCTSYASDHWPVIVQLRL